MTSQQQLKRSLKTQKFRNASNAWDFIFADGYYMFSTGIELFWFQGLWRKKAMCGDNFRPSDLI